MRKLIFFLGIILIVSCKSSEKTSNTRVANTLTKGKNTGVVSHQYKAEGCGTIIIANIENDKPLNLIPMNAMDAKFDKDNLKISFDYLPLRVKNPEGCNKGIPAQISNIAIE
ncbi:MAG: hypothetical protein HXX18_04485 [Bacteroidetes bacterium]|nr:hypothetical protein [Bacteroidota bacterium]